MCRQSNLHWNNSYLQHLCCSKRHPNILFYFRIHAISSIRKSLKEKRFLKLNSEKLRSECVKGLFWKLIKGLRIFFLLLWNCKPFVFFFILRTVLKNVKKKMYIYRKYTSKVDKLFFIKTEQNRCVVYTRVSDQ